MSKALYRLEVDPARGSEVMRELSRRDSYVKFPHADFEDRRNLAVVTERPSIFNNLPHAGTATLTKNIYKYEWDIKVEADDVEGAIAALQTIKETWNEGDEPLSGGAPEGELGPRMSWKVTKKL